MAENWVDEVSCEFSCSISQWPVVVVQGFLDISAVSPYGSIFEDLPISELVYSAFPIHPPVLLSSAGPTHGWDGEWDINQTVVWIRAVFDNSYCRFMNFDNCLWISTIYQTVSQSVCQFGLPASAVLEDIIWSCGAIKSPCCHDRSFIPFV